VTLFACLLDAPCCVFWVFRGLGIERAQFPDRRTNFLALAYIANDVVLCARRDLAVYCGTRFRLLFRTCRLYAAVCALLVVEILLRYDMYMRACLSDPLFSPRGFRPLSYIVRIGRSRGFATLLAIILEKLRWMFAACSFISIRNSYYGRMSRRLTPLSRKGRLTLCR